MLSAAEKRLIRTLHRKTERQERRLFLVEGPTLVREALGAGWAIERVAATSEWPVPPALKALCVTVTQDDLCAVSAMESPNQVLAVVRMPEEVPPPLPAGLALCLDGVQDPGNMGTILRSAAWFGVERVVCSPDCVERFNPKVVQASMGAVFRLPVHVADLPRYLAGLPASTTLAGAVLDGENVYRVAPSEPAALVLGNEARGLSEEVRTAVRRAITIPRIGSGESLNVAMAATVLCSVWRAGALTRAGAPPVQQ
jgi:TrmH family RNA methyltransferase